MGRLGGKILLNIFSVGPIPCLNPCRWRIQNKRRHKKNKFVLVVETPMVRETPPPSLDLSGSYTPTPPPYVPLRKQIVVKGV